MLYLNRNEYFFSHHPEVMKAYHAAEDKALSYYSSPVAMSELASHLGCALSLPSQHPPLLFHGAEDALVKLFAWLRRSCCHLVIDNFSWGNYVLLGEGFNYEIRRVSISRYENSRFTADLFSLEQELAKLPASLVVLASPNNPTGHSIPVEKLEGLISAYPHHTFFLDIVYDHFFSSPLLSLYDKKNVIITGSFSKFFGLPGLRLGFCTSNAAIVPSSFRLNLGMNPAVVAACSAALCQRQWYEENRKLMLKEADAIRRDFYHHPRVQPCTTTAPFLLVNVKGIESDSFSEAEKGSGVCPRYIEEPSGIFWIRFTLGPPDICKKIRDYLSFL